MIEQNSNPNYRIRYKLCTYDKNHEGESLNFVCLNQSCCQSSLICSMCRNDQHRNHLTQPLKFYLETLKIEYQNNSRNLEKQMESLEESRTLFLCQLKQAVEKIANQFCKLEEDVIARFEEFKKQIVEEKSRRQKFLDFYASLVSQTGENSEFLIQNYLPRQQLSRIENLSFVESLGADLSNRIKQAKAILFSKSLEQPKKNSFNQTMSLANTITKTNNLYTQTNFTNTAQTLSAMQVNISEALKNGKIKLKITKLKKGGVIHIGAIRKDYFEALNHKQPNWMGPESLNKLFFYNNHSAVYGQTTSQLKTSSQGSNIEVSMNKQMMKISMKKHNAEFKIPQGDVFYFFFSLSGNAEIELIYVK